VLPAYLGGSIGNIAPSILAAFTGTPNPADGLLPPLLPEALHPAFLQGARVIVLIAIDGMGAGALNRGNRLGSFGHGYHSRTDVTSVFPSTTAAALTTLQNGVAPGTHGMVGYTLFIQSLGRVVNMVFFKPVDGGSFDPTRLKLRSFVPVPTVFDRLADVGIPSVVVSHREYSRSPLTIVQSGDTPYAGHRTATEFAHLLLRNATLPGRRLVFGYWAGLDMLEHTYGPDSAVCGAELDLLQQVLLDGFLSPLQDSGEDVAVIITADHGQASVPEDQTVPLAALSTASGGWKRAATGERRSLGLKMSDNAAQRLAAAVEGRGVVLSVADALKAGLYGPGALHHDVEDRIGNTLLLARDRTSFPFRPPRSDSSEPSLGAHGSLTADEMLVPLLCWRFGT
jgi:hypothetical protein